MLLSIARRLSIFTVLLTALALVGCNEKENEPEARKAFIEFLKQEVLARKDYNLPSLGSKERKAFGRYAAHYEILVNARQSVKKLYSTYFNNGKVLLAGYSITDLKSLQSSWRAIITTRAGIEKFVTDLEVIAQEVNRDIAALKQPEDLGVIYNQVLTAKVLEPIGLAKNLAPLTDNTLKVLTEYGKFLDENRNKLVVTSLKYETKDPTAKANLEVLEEKLSRALAPMLKAINDSKNALSD